MKVIEKNLVIAGLCLLVMTVFTGLSARKSSLRQRPVAVRQQRREPPAVFRSRNSERTIIDRRMSSHVPVRITFVDKFDADDWLQKMEIEIENTSNKPVYAVSIDVEFPDIPKIMKDGSAHGYAFPVYYGRPQFIWNTEELAKDDDAPIKPGQKALVRIHPNMWKGLKEYLKANSRPESILKRVILDIEDISFGDGSGYQVDTSYYPRKVSRSGPQPWGTTDEAELTTVSFRPQGRRAYKLDGARV